MNTVAQYVYTMYHLGMKTNIMQWGNSLAVRIPTSLAKPKYSLNTLVEKITSKNIHNEVDTGPTIGKEQW